MAKPEHLQSAPILRCPQVLQSHKDVGKTQEKKEATPTRSNSERGGADQKAAMEFEGMVLFGGHNYRTSFRHFVFLAAGDGLGTEHAS